VATLANNHVMDWGESGLAQTLDVLDGAGIRVVGAGRDDGEAWRPVVVARGPHRVSVFGLGALSSGIPHQWAARPGRPGVAFLADLDDRALDAIASVIADAGTGDDVVVASIHWGANWGYGLPEEHRRFAHRLIDRVGVDVVHGHSSHHPLGIEVHRDRLIIYGCGDLVTDYEGIGGHRRYRGELGALYVATLEHTGRLRELRIVPTKVERFRLARPSSEEVGWLAGTLDREGRPLGTTVNEGGDGTLLLEWGHR
jgi:poly-gamma-glutamate synthesis protein (capsule biosynthesis protein)